MSLRFVISVEIRKKPRESREKKSTRNWRNVQIFRFRFQSSTKINQFSPAFFFCNAIFIGIVTGKNLVVRSKEKTQTTTHPRSNQQEQQKIVSQRLRLVSKLSSSVCFVLFLENVSIRGSYPRSGKKSELICLTFQVEPIFDCFRRANAPKKPFFCLQTAYYICVPFHFEPIFDKFCRANALEKSFVWLRTAFAWKVKLLSNTFAWVQNSLIFS